MLTPNKILELAENNYGYNTGICSSCGEIHSGIEPDAAQYECNNCGQYTVYGCENILIVDGHTELLNND
jgi:predicted RNA-binding Zn-ribbon protein involved in translation (DUF1610 family)